MCSKPVIGDACLFLCLSAQKISHTFQKYQFYLAMSISFVRKSAQILPKRQISGWRRCFCFESLLKYFQKQSGTKCDVSLLSVSKVCSNTSKSDFDTGMSVCFCPEPFKYLQNFIMESPCLSVSARGSAQNLPKLHVYRHIFVCLGRGPHIFKSGAYRPMFVSLCPGICSKSFKIQQVRIDVCPPLLDCSKSYL
jgi:hypothetical protein